MRVAARGFLGALSHWTENARLRSRFPPQAEDAKREYSGAHRRGIAALILYVRCVVCVGLTVFSRVPFDTREFGTPQK